MSRPSGIFDEKYEQDYIIIRTPIQKIAFASCLSAFLIGPLVLSSYLMVLLSFIFIAIIGALGLNLLMGYTGQISLGQAALMAVGAYTCAWSTIFLGLDFISSVIIGGLSTMLMGLVIGIPSLKIKGFYLAITTLLAHYLIFFILSLPQLEPIVQPWYGLRLPRTKIFLFEVPSEYRVTIFYYILFTSAVLAIITCNNIVRSKLGRAFIAIRDNDNVAEVLGVDVFKYKLLSFAISSFYVGVAGALYAYYVKIIVPGHFDIRVTIEYIAMILIGGLGRIWGSILGAIILILLSEVLRITVSVYLTPVFPAAAGLLDPLRVMIFGSIIILIIILEPQGFVALLRRIKEYFKLWPFRY